MSNPAWGTKRICPSCSSKYYDLDHTPIICPKCQTEFDPSTVVRLRSDPRRVLAGRSGGGFGRAAVARRYEPEDALEQSEPEKPTEEGDEDAVEDVAELGDENDESVDSEEGEEA
jgi:uncharacterized protein (TIGR02300 family)